MSVMVITETKEYIISPCPFCGRDYDIMKEEDGQFTIVCSVHHNGCGGASGWKGSKSEAIEAWNRRGGEWGALILETTEDEKPEEKKEEVVHNEVGRSKEELARMMQTCVSCDDCPMTKDCIGLTQQCLVMWEKWLGDKGEEIPVIRKLEENGNLTVSGMIKKLQEFENDGLGDKVVKFEDDMWGERGIHKSEISYVGKCVLIQ